MLDMRTVFHHADGTESEHVLENVENLLEDETVSIDAVDVVANADGVYTLTEDSEHANRVRSLHERHGVRFAACANSLSLRNIAEERLVPGVETVPAGVGELTRLQHDGYAYVKD